MAGLRALLILAAVNSGAPLAGAERSAADFLPGFHLAGEPVAFDAGFRPLFTRRQKAETDLATRQGFDKWAQTDEGRRIVDRFRAADRCVIVREDDAERSLGRAPQPGFLILLTAGDSKINKRYELVLNPRLAAGYRHHSSVDLGLPQTPADAMALAWAAEMLHIDFYASGIALPHHEKPEFQRRWLAVATQLGFPNTEHGGDERLFE